jgi:hypothetical protein
MRLAKLGGSLRVPSPEQGISKYCKSRMCTGQKFDLTRLRKFKRALYHN